jgi:hypothetical protein
VTCRVKVKWWLAGSVLCSRKLCGVEAWHGRGSRYDGGKCVKEFDVMPTTPRPATIDTTGDRST